VQDVFSQVQRVFIVEHYLATCSYLTCQNEFRDTFPYSPVPNKPALFRTVNRFHDTGTLHGVTSDRRKRVNAFIAEGGGHFRHLTSFLVFLFQCNYLFLTNRTCVTNGLRDFRSPHTVQSFGFRSEHFGKYFTGSRTYVLQGTPNQSHTWLRRSTSVFSHQTTTFCIILRVLSNRQYREVRTYRSSRT
jgi:hypothetical protein